MNRNASGPAAPSRLAGQGRQCPAPDHPTNGLVFPDLNSSPFGGETSHTNLVMPEPCPFISRDLPACSVIRPTETKGIAMGVVTFLTDMGQFIGQQPAFFQMLQDLAADADRAKRRWDCAVPDLGRLPEPAQVKPAR